MTQLTWLNICCYWLETRNRTPVLGNSAASVRDVWGTTVSVVRGAATGYTDGVLTCQKIPPGVSQISHIASSAARVTKPEDREPEKETETHRATERSEK